MPRRGEIPPTAYRGGGTLSQNQMGIQTYIHAERGIRQVAYLIEGTDTGIVVDDDSFEYTTYNGIPSLYMIDKIFVTSEILSLIQKNYKRIVNITSLRSDIIDLLNKLDLWHDVYVYIIDERISMVDGKLSVQENIKVSDHLEYHGDIMSMTFDGSPIYYHFNADRTFFNYEFDTKFNEILAKHDLYYEFGHSWSLSLYPNFDNDMIDDDDNEESNLFDELCRDYEYVYLYYSNSEEVILDTRPLTGDHGFDCHFEEVGGNLVLYDGREFVTATDKIYDFVSCLSYMYSGRNQELFDSEFPDAPSRVVRHLRKKGLKYET